MSELNLIRVYVHLARGFSAASWAARWDQGKIPGMNERCPYGYSHAEQFGCEMSYSDDHEEGHLLKLIRGGVRFFLGFDFVHAFRNRHKLRNADVVWTHTESQYLAILLLLKGLSLPRRPLVIGQSVWLFEHWSGLNPAHRALYRWLIKDVDVLTFLSPMNRAEAQARFPGVPTQFVPFGIRHDTTPPRRREVGGKLRVLALGNDRHRDWSTLIEGLRNRTDCELRIASHKISAQAASGASNVEICRPVANEELQAVYDWADAVFVPLVQNKHASGITVLLEATAHGLPIVATKVGGLDAYFSDDEIIYVPPGDPAALGSSVSRMIEMGTDGRAGLAARAQARLGPHALSSVSYAREHARLSYKLMGRPWPFSDPT